MTLRKITINKNVRYIPQSEQTQQRDSTPKTIKVNHFLVNKSKILHKIIMKKLNILQQKDFQQLRE